MYKYTKEDVQKLVDAAKDFVNKVDTGRAQSTDSYNKFKKALVPFKYTVIDLGTRNPKPNMPTGNGLSD